jgi:suppressor of ftsI
MKLSQSMRRLSWIIASLLLQACVAKDPRPPNLPDLPEQVSRQGIASLTLTAKLDARHRPALYWRNLARPPLIRVNPGDHIRIHVRNLLPRICGLGMISNLNLHFHGFNSSPKSPGDDVLTRRAKPGGDISYDVAINPGQPPGLYWYHAHAHGLSSWEVGNGMAGAIIVNGLVHDAPQVRGLRERVIILQDIPSDPRLQAIEREFTEIPIQVAPTPDKLGIVKQYVKPLGNDDGPTCQPDHDFTPTINGVPFARIGIRPGERELLRIVNAASFRHFFLNVAAPVQLVAQDGVALTEYPGAHPMMVQQLLVPPAGRVEFVVTGTVAPMRLYSSCFSAGIAGDPNPPLALADFYDDTGDADAARERVETPSSARKPSWYRVPMPKPQRTRIVRLGEGRKGFSINGRRYTPSDKPMFIAKSGTVERWIVENDTDENHAFHLHQVHFVVKSINGFPNSTPHWVDVADIPPQGRGARYGDLTPTRVELLVDFRDPLVRGIFLFHCHILDHEDGGMSAKILVR